MIQESVKKKQELYDEIKQLQNIISTKEKIIENQKQKV